MSAPDETPISRGEAMEFTRDAQGVGRLRFTRAQEMNTINVAFMREFDAAIDAALAQSLRVLILTGSGKTFCGGAQLTYFSDPNSPFGNDVHEVRRTYVGEIVRMFDRLEQAPFVTIAAINGHALGGGCELALACDLRIMAHAGLIGVPEVKLGVIPAGGGVYRLARVLGRGKALEMILLGQRLQAAEAERIGLVIRAVEPDALDAAATALADEVLLGGPTALAMAKQAVYRGETADLAGANAATDEAFAGVLSSSDWTEGSSAFLEKRKPRW